MLEVGTVSDVEIRNVPTASRTGGDALGRSGDVVEVLVPNDTAYFAVRSVRVEV
ncbi:hypothetical protein [Nocardia abscessus]|uniref:hypothetical protein n=1 Tax=Nocardia abscessus TaxID=120957 RepID=UPI00245890C9|nr:hypothetical protein [Nocardia abscessus]